MTSILLSYLILSPISPITSYIQSTKTALDIANDKGDDEAKEALLSGRFPSEDVETEFLQERLPQLIEKALVSLRYYII